MYHNRKKVDHLAITFQTEPDVLDFYKARINFFYNGNADKIDFEKFDQELKEKINSRDPQSGKLVEHFSFHSEKPMAVFSLNNLVVSSDLFLNISLIK